jgi:hypothetical protein
MFKNSKQPIIKKVVWLIGVFQIMILPNWNASVLKKFLSAYFASIKTSNYEPSMPNKSKGATLKKVCNKIAMSTIKPINPNITNNWVLEVF